MEIEISWEFQGHFRLNAGDQLGGGSEKGLIVLV
jgi:hypothetical protein